MTAVPTWPVMAMMRHGVHLGVGEAGDEVGGAGAAGGDADADLAGGAGVALGREAAALLVARQDGAQAIVDVRQRLVNGHAGAAGVGEDDLDAVVEQALDQDGGPRLRQRLRFGHCDELQLLKDGAKLQAAIIQCSVFSVQCSARRWDKCAKIKRPGAALWHGLLTKGLNTSRPVFTPKGLHNEARGKPRSGATPGTQTRCLLCNRFGLNTTAALLEVKPLVRRACHNTLDPIDAALAIL